MKSEEDVRKNVCMDERRGAWIDAGVRTKEKIISSCSALSCASKWLKSMIRHKTMQTNSAETKLRNKTTFVAEREKVQSQPRGWGKIKLCLHLSSQK